MIIESESFSHDKNELDPMYDAVSYKNSYAINKLLEKVGLAKHLMEELNEPLLCGFLNSRISEADVESEHVNSKEIDYGFLDCAKYTNCKNGSCLESLNWICDQSSLKHLIQHPVLSLFIDRQFERLGKLFTVNSFIFICFGALAIVLDEPFIMGFYLSFRELIQIFLACQTNNFKEYRTSYTNWFDILLIIGVFVMQFFEKEYAVIIVTFLGLIQSIMISSEWRPTFALKMFILLKIMGRFLKLFLMVVPIILSFGIGFHLIFKNCVLATEKELNKFTTVFNSVFKTFIMLTGELEFKEICALKTGFSQIFFMCFLLSAVIIFNFLGALIIIDIEVRISGFFLKWRSNFEGGWLVKNH